MSGLANYRVLLGQPGARPLVGWSLLGRLPLGMTPLALLFLLRGQGYDYGAAGVVVAGYAVAAGVGAPIAGRRVDRRGPSRVLRLRAVVYAGFLGLAVAAALLDLGLAAVAVAASAAGLAMPPLSATVRVVWPRLAPDGLRSTAYALEAALQEVFFLGGPLIAAALAALDPALGVAGAALAGLVGTTATARLRPVRETPASRGESAGLLGALASPGVRTVVLYSALIGAGFGAVELAMPAFAEAHGSRELGGVALACFSGGSLVGGLLAGTRPQRSDLRRFLLGSFVLAVALLGFQLAVSIPTLCVLAFVAGLPIAPTIAAVYTLIDRSAVPGTVAEAFAWFGTAISVGIAVGTAAAGGMVDTWGTRLAFGVGAALAFAGALASFARRGTLAGAPLQQTVTRSPAGDPSTLPGERP